jgi:hypothetical protein
MDLTLSEACRRAKYACALRKRRTSSGQRAHASSRHRPQARAAQRAASTAQESP